MHPRLDTGAVQLALGQHLLAVEHEAVAGFDHNGAAGEGAEAKLRSLQVDEHADRPAGHGIRLLDGQPVEVAGRQVAIERAGLGQRGGRDLDRFEELRALAPRIDTGALRRFLDRLDRLMLAVEGYASPELVVGAPVMTASDVYQLGLLVVGDQVNPFCFVSQFVTLAAQGREVTWPHPTVSLVSQSFWP